MAATITVLQLDTQFPRVPGDVASVETYCDEIEIIRVANASVDKIVSSKPDQINIEPFEQAIKSASGDIIVTSCGFLSFWQNHLAAQTTKPFISSALTVFEILKDKYKPTEVLTLTFDDASLTSQHFGAYPEYATGIVGLPPDMHLRRVIEENRASLDVNLVQSELLEFVLAKIRPHHKHIVLECTNLPPYKAAIQAATGLNVTDILSCIEAKRKHSVRPEFL